MIPVDSQAQPAAQIFIAVQDVGHAGRSQRRLLVRNLSIFLLFVASLTLELNQKMIVWQRNAKSMTAKNSHTGNSTSVRSKPRCNDVDSALNHTLQRGLNVITPVSGCHLAAWVYEAGPPKFQSCWPLADSHRQLATKVAEFSGTPPGMQPNDTVFVNVKGLWDFCQNILPQLNVSITLITGQYHKSRTDMMSTHLAQTLLNHPLIAKWFCHNIDVHIPLVLTNHSKLPLMLVLSVNFPNI
jgi:hypothetical protein